jgi:hypothetical protein
MCPTGNATIFFSLILWASSLLETGREIVFDKLEMLGSSFLLTSVPTTGLFSPESVSKRNRFYVLFIASQSMGAFKVSSISLQLAPSYGQRASSLENEHLGSVGFYMRRCKSHTSKHKLWHLASSSFSCSCWLPPPYLLCFLHHLFSSC